MSSSSSKKEKYWRLKMFVKVKQRTQLFLAPETWSLPVVYRGLLYITQNDMDRGGGTSKPRWLCYDFRAPADTQ